MKYIRKSIFERKEGCKMDLLEHYIRKIHSVKNITQDFEKHCGYVPEEDLYEVDLTYDCYGMEKRTKTTFWESNFERVKQCGYYMA